ncbi:MAG: serine--tRNA ligase [Alphaproteobacteria bacterium]
MHDIRWIRDNAAAFDAAMARRGLEPVSGTILALDGDLRTATSALQEMQTRRNEASKEIGRLKRDGGDADALMAEVAGMKTAMPALEERIRALETERDGLLAGLPNMPAAEVPDGRDEADNAELRRWGTPRDFAFPPKEHDALGEALGLMDFATAAKLSGARFVLLRGALALLERALGDLMLDMQTREHGYTEISPPLLVRDTALFGTNQLPKFAQDQFRTTDDYWLIPTAEVPLTNIVADMIVDEADLPLRFTARTPCFRSEAGAAGKDTRGMIRQHQFTKVEMVSITRPEDSAAEHERMTGCAEAVLQRLALPYRVVSLCTGDLGFGAVKTHDLEVWLPGQGAYREISSCSNCGPFQARRMKARYRPADGKGPAHVHTLNGSGLAVGRALIAVVENYQQEDGSVTVPDALRPYMNGMERISANA